MKTILIIEDDIVFSRSISNWLVKKGMKTECVATLANARKAIGQKEFDLILADLRLPDGNSTSLLKWMNEKYYSIPFLIDHDQLRTGGECGDNHATGSHQLPV